MRFCVVQNGIQKSAIVPPRVLKKKSLKESSSFTQRRRRRRRMRHVLTAPATFIVFASMLVLQCQAFLAGGASSRAALFSRSSPSLSLRAAWKRSSRSSSTTSSLGMVREEAEGGQLTGFIGLGIMGQASLDRVVLLQHHYAIAPYCQLCHHPNVRAWRKI
jgi:hypothetical protein